MASEGELESKLNQSRVIARGIDAAEISGVPHNLPGGLIQSAGGSDRVEIANWICKVDMIEQIEKLHSELESLSFTERKMLRN